MTLLPSFTLQKDLKKLAKIYDVFDLIIHVVWTSLGCIKWLDIAGFPFQSICLNPQWFWSESEVNENVVFLSKETEHPHS